MGVKQGGEIVGTPANLNIRCKIKKINNSERVLA
jgi:hypothetical protein